MTKIIIDINKSLCSHSPQRPTDAAKTQRGLQAVSQLFSQSCPLGYFTVDSFASERFHFSLPFSLDHFALFLDIIRRQDLNTECY